MLSLCLCNTSSYLNDDCQWLTKQNTAHDNWRVQHLVLTLWKGWFSFSNKNYLHQLELIPGLCLWPEKVCVAWKICMWTGHSQVSTSCWLTLDWTTQTFSDTSNYGTLSGLTLLHSLKSHLPLAQIIYSWLIPPLRALSPISMTTYYQQRNQS